MLLAATAHAGHTQWPIVKEELVDTCMEKRYRLVERCARLQGALPMLARVVPQPCFTEPDRNCLPNGLGGAYDWEHRTILLPDGNSHWFEHEALHHLLFVNGFTDWREHTHAIWKCQ